MTRMRLRTQELCPQQRIYTTDAARSRDTRLSAEATPKNPAMLGRNWVGVLRERLESLSATDRSIVIDELQRGLGAYAQGMHSGATMRPSNFGSLGTGAPEEVFDVGAGADPEAINSANREFWDGANRSVTQDTARHTLSTAATPQTIMAASRKFWTGRNGAPVGQGQLPVRDARPASGGGVASIEAINRANADFWQRATAHQHVAPKRWGEG